MTMLIVLTTICCMFTTLCAALSLVAFSLARKAHRATGLQLGLWNETERLWWHHLKCHEIIDERFGTATATKPNFHVVRNPQETN